MYGLPVDLTLQPKVSVELIKKQEPNHSLLTEAIY
jgi:hypothetical protein